MLGFKKKKKQELKNSIVKSKETEYQKENRIYMELTGKKKDEVVK